MSDRLRLILGDRSFTAHVEAAAPKTAAWLLSRLPLENVAIHARWSGEAAWVKLDERPDIAFENATAYPAPGQLLLYVGDASEPEILIPYGPCAFACRAGPLAGNHFATIREDLLALRAIGEGLLLHGATRFRIEAA